MSLLHLRGASLGWRLGLAFALIVALSCGALGLYLYQSFAQQLQQRDDVQLLGKLRQLRSLLGNAATPRLLLDQPQYLRDTMSGESNALILVHDAQGQLLLSINPAHEALPRSPALGVETEPGAAALRRWHTASGTPAAGLVARARLGHGPEVEITLARLYPERERLLADYRYRILLATLLAAAGAAALALLLLWQGLAPLRRLAQQAGEITAQRLTARLVAADAPAELRAMIEAYNAMLARLQQGFERISQFAADLAHELRTPLSNLVVQSQVMLSQARDAQAYRSLVESNLEELDRLSRMIDSMLFIARAEHSAVALRRESLDIAAELERQAAYFEDLAEERGLRIACEGAGRLDADALLLRRALANLLANALRHARPGSVITLAVRDDEPGWVTLELANEGEPVPPAALAQLFERFYRADPSRTDSAQSTGLGLAIVRSIMALHGGEACVTQSGSRICFGLRFPRSG